MTCPKCENTRFIGRQLVSCYVDVLVDAEGDYIENVDGSEPDYVDAEGPYPYDGEFWKCAVCGEMVEGDKNADF